MKIKLSTSVAALALAGLIGCGSDEDRYPLVPVSGTVTENGKPLAGATITFLPDQGNPYNTPGTDSTGPEGNYRLMFRSRTGVSPGKYKVAITLPIVDPEAKISEEFKDDPLMGQMALGVDRAPRKPKKGAGVKNEFEAQVENKGGTLDFDVKGTLTR
jgi:hypothetical protein